MKSTTRIYQGPDAAMAETARTIYNLLVQDLSAFSAVNSRFTATFAADYLNQITAADEVITDSETAAAVGVETEQVLQLWIVLACCITDLKIMRFGHFPTVLQP